MTYYFSKTITDKSFDQVIALVTEELKKEGFGVVTEIDMKETFKKKIEVDFRKYKILGACHPQFAHKILMTDDKIGVFLPCNVVVQELASGSIEVFAVDPVASMIAVKNDSLMDIATQVQQKLKTVVGNIH